MIGVRTVEVVSSRKEVAVVNLLLKAILGALVSVLALSLQG